MADQKITELAALGATPDDADILPMVDDVVGTPTTKKVTVANLLAGAGGVSAHDSEDNYVEGGEQALGKDSWVDANNVTCSVTCAAGDLVLAIFSAEAHASSGGTCIFTLAHDDGGSYSRVEDTTDAQKISAVKYTDLSMSTMHWLVPISAGGTVTFKIQGRGITNAAFFRFRKLSVIVFKQ